MTAITAVRPVGAGERDLGQCIVALYASDMPSRRGEWTHEQLAAWVAQGIERLGGEDRVRELDLLATLIVRTTDWRAGACPEDHPEWRRLWPKPRRRLVASDLAYDLMRADAACTGGRP
ncbi:hypothetical protein ACNF49_38320 [Actinomadura sp. ATCC 39365]